MGAREVLLGSKNGSYKVHKRKNSNVSQLEQIRKFSDDPLRSVLTELGGWPVTQPNWQEPNVSIEVLLGRLRGDYNEGVLIEQWVGPDDKNSSVNILQVRKKLEPLVPRRDVAM
ncbi:Membrane metallo-endopeptidase-like 1 [Homalodisca vitripennis]|nr:Membrane metallo-endopeptidase-like 1 [Homalodisca vitripennis]